MGTTVECVDGFSLDGHVAAWQALNQKDKETQWKKAAVCASLTRAYGQRTDRTGGPTEIQQFCTRIGIGTGYFSRLAKTHQVFVPLAPGAKRFPLDDAFLSFKHYVIAANDSVQPHVAIQEALDQRWPANELARAIVLRKGRILVDGDLVPVRAEHDDDEPDLTWQPATAVTRGGRTRYRPTVTRPQSVPNGLRRLQFEFWLPPDEAATLRRELRALALAFRTSEIADTIREAVKRAHAVVAEEKNRAIVGATDEVIDDAHAMDSRQGGEEEAIQGGRQDAHRGVVTMTGTVGTCIIPAPYYLGEKSGPSVEFPARARRSKVRRDA